MVKIDNYDFSLQKRQVAEAFELYLTKESSVLGKFLANGRGMQNWTNNKYEWLESQLTPKSWTINGSITSGTLDVSTPANLTFDSTVGMYPGYIARFEVDTTGADVGNLQVLIIAVSSATVATWIIYGWTADVTIPDNAVAVLTSEPVEENEKSFAGRNDWEPDTTYNYFQIFREQVELSDTAINSLMYGNPSQVAAQMKQAFYKINSQMSEAMIRWRRVARTASTAWLKGSFGWMEFFLSQAGTNNTDASWAVISQVLLNNLIQDIREDGWAVDTLMGNYNQARAISAFNTAWNNPIISRDEVSAGSYVMRFVSDIPVAGWLVSNIIIDERMPKDTVYLTNLDKIALVPYTNRELKLVDATLPWQDGKTALIRWEYTMVLKDAKYSHWRLTNLSI